MKICFAALHLECEWNIFFRLGHTVGWGLGGCARSILHGKFVLQMGRKIYYGNRAHENLPNFLSLPFWKL